MGKVRFALAIHNHQPVGNFEGVFEQAYQDSYLPFLEVIEDYPEIPFCLHTSGCLMEFLVDAHPEYVERIQKLVDRGQVEILGGAFYEPILPNIPSRDRIGQIRGYSEYLQDLFGSTVRGMWVAERVWEQSLVSDIAQAEIEYTILDDYHFRKAGLSPDELHGYFVSEDQGRMVRIFPGSEPMRYMIPFQEPDNFLQYMGEVRDKQSDALVVFGDDGEKFGSWPDTKAHVYEHGWLRRFLDALRNNLDWIQVTTLSDALDEIAPLGRIFLPDCSYREMTEWALPADRYVVYEQLWHDLEHDHRGREIRSFMKGGFWRNFRVKYPEANEMYARMMEVSNSLDELTRTHPEAFGDRRVAEARKELYRGQCNCSYWHGAFGGLYLPHLRNAVYSSLIKADNWLCDFVRDSEATFVASKLADLNFDGADEVRLENDKLIAYFAPSQGGRLYELDVRSIATNLGASLSRQAEGYHDKVRNAGNHHDEHCASIHDRVVLKEEGLAERIASDPYPRKSLIDHFYYADDVNPSLIQAGTAREIGDFVTGAYESRISSTGDSLTLRLRRNGSVDGCPVSVTKQITVEAGGEDLRVLYALDGLPEDREVLFAIELNFAAMPAGADDRYFHQESSQLGRLESMLELSQADELGLTDEWLGLDVGVAFSQPAQVWTMPLQSVSQSEGGFEAVHQSVCVVPHWRLHGRSQWEMELTLSLDAAVAEARKLAKAS